MPTRGNYILFPFLLTNYFHVLLITARHVTVVSVIVAAFHTDKYRVAMECSGMVVRVHLIVRHFILHYLVISNSKSFSIDTNFDAELIKDVAVS